VTEQNFARGVRKREDSASSGSEDECEMPGEDERDFLRLLRQAAGEVAQSAGQVTLSHFGSVVAAESKDDGTPVTVADRATERHLREEIEARFPSHGIVGEEFEALRENARVRWIIDPIDGTRAFMRGVPLYSVLVGVEVAGEAVVGVAHFPALGETVSAARGLGCSWSHPAAAGPVQARVSKVDSVETAATLTTDPRATLQSPIGRGWERLSGRSQIVRGWGDAYGHILVATGRADVMVDPELALWDAAPLLPILTEAGGRFTDLDGNATIHGRSGVSTNGPLHSAVLTTLSGSD